MKKLITIILLIIALLPFTSCKIDDFGINLSYCIINIHPNNGSADYKKTLKEGAILKEPEVTPMEGYTFEGWYTDETFENKYDFSNRVYEPFNLYAKWHLHDSYEVTFDMMGHGRNIPIARNQMVFEEPSTPSEYGYVFSGWYLDEEFTNRIEDGQKLTSDITVYAEWTIRSYFVHFHYSERDVRTELVELDSKIQEPVEPTREKCRFEGWYTSRDYSQKYNFDERISNDESLFAKWILTEIDPNRLPFEFNYKISNNGLYLNVTIYNMTLYYIYYFENPRLAIIGENGSLYADVNLDDIKANLQLYDKLELNLFINKAEFIDYNLPYVFRLDFYYGNVIV